MKTNFNTCIVLAALSFLFVYSAPLASAEEKCTGSDSLDIKYFPKVYRAAKIVEINLYDYKGLANKPEYLKKNFSLYIQLLGERIEEEFAIYDIYQALQDQVNQFDKTMGFDGLSSFSLQQSAPTKDHLYQFGFTSNREKAKIAKTSPCRAGSICIKKLMELTKVLEIYKAKNSKCAATQAWKYASKLVSEWERYGKESRQQTLIDASVTSWLNRDILANGRIDGPIQTQYFFMHPSLVVENASNALDGEKVTQAVALELVGVNWWNKKSSPLPFPFGVSLTSVFSDRRDTDDVGLGLTFHFNNSFSIGWARYKGLNGNVDTIYLSVDALNLLTERKSSFDKKKEALKKRIENWKLR